MASENVPLVNKRNKLTVSLHHAARDGREKIVDEWIEYYSSKNTLHLTDEYDKFGYTPLHYAAKFNRYDILVALVDAGADPTVASVEEKFTALHFSARYLPRVIDLAVQQQETEEQTQRVDKRSSSWRAISYLIHLKGDKKIEVNEPDRYGVTALHLACQRGNLKAVNMLLLTNRVNVNIVDKNGDTPLHAACLNGHVKIVEKLLEWYRYDGLPDKVNFQNNENQTPVHLACREGHLAVVQSILRSIPNKQARGALSKTCDNKGNTALHLACESGNSTIVHDLVFDGADVMAVKVEGISPMHIAARYGHIDVAETLLIGCTDVNIVDEYCQTPLHYAAEQNQVKMIYFLMERKADISAVDKKSCTPLMLAAYKGNIPAFEALLEQKANIDDIDEDSKTVVHLATEENHAELLKLILKHPDGLNLAKSTDSHLNTPLHLASKKGNIECVEVLLKYKTSIRVDAKNESNETPLHYAASKGHIVVVKALIDSQNDCIRDEDENGNTPLHLAAFNGHYQAAKVLLDYKADGEARNATLWTPMDAAAYKGHAKVMQLLIETGSDVNPVDKQKTTPLHLAAKEGHLEVANVLLKNDADVGLDANGNSPLDLAITFDHENIAMAIVKSTKWKDVLRHTYKFQEETTTPLRRLIKRMPGVAIEVFNQCSVIDESGNGVQQHGCKTIKVRFDYEFLEDFRDKSNIFSRFMDYVKRKRVETEEGLSHGAPSNQKATNTFNMQLFSSTWGPCGFSKKLHPLSIMVENNCTDLLKHPLVTSLLKLKWSIYGSTAYWLNLLVYTVFVVFLTSFALLSPNPQSRSCQAIAAGTFGQRNSDLVMYLNNTSGCVLVPMNINTSLMDESLTGAEVCSSIRDTRTMCGISDEDCGNCEQNGVRQDFLVIAAAIAIGFAMIRLSFEVFQMISLSYYYIQDWVNFVELTLFACAIIFSSVFTDPCLCPTTWQWQIGCVAVFLAWIDFIIFFHKFPLTGIYVLMFVDIFKTFWKMFFLTMLLVVAFGLTFYMVFDDPSPPFARSSFATPGRSLLKTMTMTTGEFEYDAIFRQYPGGAEEGGNTSEVPFFPVSVILWIIFLILMPILLTNLLVGLAVDDIKGIQNAAELKRLELQVELALSVEEQMPVYLRRYFIKPNHTIELNQKLGPYQFLQYRIFGNDKDQFYSPENIYRALHPTMAPIEQVQAQTDSLLKDMKQMKEAIQELVVERNVSMDMKQMKEAIQQLVARNVAMEGLIHELAKRPVPAHTDESTTSAADNIVSEI